MPNRIIKESILTSDKLGNLSWFEEVLFYRLIVSCDDYGRYDGRPQIIRNLLFPLKDGVTVKTVEAALDSLASQDLVNRYFVSGTPYLCLPGWANHQRVRNARPKYPGPEEADASPQVAASRGKSRPESNPIQSNPNPNPIHNGNARAHEEKKPYGEFGKVMLTDKELEKLKTDYPSCWQSYIDKVDTYVASTGKAYKSHYATILAWMKKDGVSAGSTGPSYFGGGQPGKLELEAVQRMMAQENQLGSLGEFELNALDKMMKKE